MGFLSKLHKKSIGAKLVKKAISKDPIGSNVLSKSKLAQHTGLVDKPRRTKSGITGGPMKALGRSMSTGGNQKPDTKIMNTGGNSKPAGRTMNTGGNSKPMVAAKRPPSPASRMDALQRPTRPGGRRRLIP